MNVARRRMSRKLAFLLVTPVLLGFSLFGVLQARIWEQALLEDAERQLSDHAASVKAMVRLSPGPVDREALTQAVQDISEREQVHGIAFYGQGASPIAVSTLLLGGNSMLPDIVQKVGETGQPYRAVEKLGESEVLLHVEPLRLSDGLSAFAIAHSLSRMSSMMREAFFRIALTGGLLSLVLFVLALLLSRSLGKSLGALVYATEHVSSGDLAISPIESSGILDLSRVSNAFNSMILALREAREGLDASERARRSMERRALHAQALAAAGQVTGAFAHEIGSPLNTILGLSRLCAADENLPAQTRKQMETVAAQCERITRMVQRMLGVVRVAQDKHQSVRVAEVIHEVQAFLEADLKNKGIDIRLDISPVPPVLMGSRDFVFQMLLNLCNNAADAQPKGGLIRISLKPGESQDKKQNRPQAVILEVADAGPGIPEEQRERIFEPFYSTKAVQGGTGLGLSIVASIVRDAGGSITVSQAPEGGALFQMLLLAAQ